MLIETENILSRFSKNIKWATSIDIATAWATANEGLYKLQERSEHLEIRTIVGLWNNISDPLVLRILNRLGELRIVNTKRRFHPKIYVFRSPKKSVAWVGSANFTSGGFGSNEELLFETQNTRAIKNWFERLWQQCGPLKDGAIDEYAEKRKRNPPKPRPRTKKSMPRLENGPLALLQNVDDWNSYLVALERCDRWWMSRIGYSVLGEARCWEETIRELHVVVKEDWGRIVDDEKKCLLGLRGTDPKWALLGRMRPQHFNTIFLNERNLNTVQDAIYSVAGAGDKNFPDAAIDAYEKIISINNLGHANATRLLALARPDYIVSFNSESRSGLAKYLGLALPKGLLPPERYRNLLESIYEKPWFNVPRPETPHEQGIWSMRAALIDCFVYNGKGPN